MKIETTIRRTELTVERTETLRISWTRRFVYERYSDNPPDARDAAAEMVLELEEIVECEGIDEFSPSTARSENMKFSK